MRLWAAVALGLAFCVFSCGISKVKPVPLLTDESQSDGGCWLLHIVVDVVADRATGTPTIKDTGEHPIWPNGYTARRAGSEVEVVRGDGSVALRTGGRYWMCPTPETDYTKSISAWVIGEVKPCPDCELGGGPD